MQPTSTQRSLTLGFLEYHLASLGRHWGVIGRDREMSDSYPNFCRCQDIPVETLHATSLLQRLYNVFAVGIKRGCQPGTRIWYDDR
ncbi:hypothetical protein [Coleofasciculus sp. F4-SAH-05]|uniref:hypothetical protein n=1 Tax=Coleofasciculus TaxID=669368 RepID=UPI0032F8EDB5